MKLKDIITDIGVRLALYRHLLEQPECTPELRQALTQAIEVTEAELEVLRADALADPMGYLAWRVADDNEPEQQRVRKFRQ